MPDGHDVTAVSPRSPVFRLDPLPQDAYELPPLNVAGVG